MILKRLVERQKKARHGSIKVVVRDCGQNLGPLMSSLILALTLLADIMASRAKARARSPQYRQGARQLSSNDADPEPSKLVAHLLQLMWVGSIPASQIQLICAAAEADGLQHRDVRRPAFSSLFD